MVGKRERVARILDASRLSSTLLAMRARTPPVWLTVLTYHRVGRPSPDDPFPDETYDASPGLFAEQIRFLSERFHFVTTDEVLAYLDGGRLPPNPVLITFDDGYRECLTEALPTLLDYGAKATFFIATDYVEHRRLFWWDRIGLLVERAKEDPIVLDYPRELHLSRDEAYEPLVKMVKSERGLDLERFLDHLAERADASIGSDEEKALVDRFIMTWEEIQQLVDAGMDVQSHTRSHRVMQTLLDDQLLDELGGSRALLEERLGVPIRSLAFPVGYPIGEAPQIRAALRETGYRAAYANQTGAQPCFGKVDRFQIDRIAMSEIYRDAMFRSTMAFPPLAMK
jgi:peptidoglycan/xylan/chitin deacetylase (PgdA/CDA1 family)